ncbi:MAG: glycosyltransferase family 9 protein [Clostridia bacterium]|nr:glycosyltransferase family 9 protein [Clostridia bacterium]
MCPLGDTLFATPALRALRRRFPEARVVVLAWASNAPILEGNPNVDEVWVAGSTLDLPRLARRVLEGGFQLGVGLSNLGSWFLMVSGVPLKVGFNAQSLGRFYVRPAPDRRDVHAVDYCLSIVGALGAPVDDRRLELPLGAQDRAEAERFLREEVGPAPLLVAIHPGGRHFRAKRWFPARFGRLADELTARFGARVVLVGGSEDVRLAEQIRLMATSRPAVAAGRLRLKATAALLERADLFVGNDSAPLHMAAAVGTPTVALFGPTDPVNFRPIGDHHRIVRRDLPCSPCFHWLGGPQQYLQGCRNQECRHQCMKEIGVEEVVGAVAASLGLPWEPEGNQVMGPEGV